jgi:hypothetical protein
LSSVIARASRITPEHGKELAQTKYQAAGVVLIGLGSELILGQKAFGAFDSEGSPDRNERADEIDEPGD